MSPLWSGKNTKLSINQVKPSPTYYNVYSDLAQNPGNFTNCKKLKFFSSLFIEGSSLLMSLRKQVMAGMTVEASLVLPLFIFLFMNVGSVIEMIRLHSNVQLALWQVGNEIALYEYAVESGFSGKEESVEEETDSKWWEKLTGVVFSSTYIKWRLIESMGEEYLESSPLARGAAGLNLWESEPVNDKGEVEIVVTYAVEPFSNFGGVFGFRMANQYYGHAWTGYRIAKEVSQAEQEDLVYITENGEVYHLLRSCAHLELSVREIASGQVKRVRNLYGGRYDPCEKCAKGGLQDRLYIADEGDCYHYKRDCPGLSRTIYLVPMSEAEGLRACSRCAKEK